MPIVTVIPNRVRYHFQMFELNSSGTSSAPQNTASFRINKTHGPYNGWQLYFPEIEYEDNLPIVRKIRAFEQHIKSHPLHYKFDEIRQNLSFPLSLQRLQNDETFCQHFPNFMKNLNTNVKEILMCAGLAVHQRIHTDLQPITLNQAAHQKNLTKLSLLPNQGANHENQTKLSLLPIRARIHDHSPITNLSTLKDDIYNSLISVRGTVVRVNPSILKSSWIAYKCPKCTTEQAIRQTDVPRGVTPTSCKGIGCLVRSNFIILQNSPYIRTEPYQTIRLQESAQIVKGQIPKTNEIDLTDDLVDTVGPGDESTVTGIVRVRTNEKSNVRGRAGSEAGIHNYYIFGITIISNKNTIVARNLDFNEQELNIIKNIGQQTNVFKLLVNSLCPRIFGHEMVKAGLILSLFGASGNGINTNIAPDAKKRSEIHVLIVGDPGLGKSHLIQSCSNISPRGIFICGNTTSNAGLTLSIRNDKNSDGSLEAGALVLADQGVCCIDEFDKMSTNYQSLLQVMEQQSVSVAKAGVLCAILRENM